MRWFCTRPLGYDVARPGIGVSVCMCDRRAPAMGRETERSLTSSLIISMCFALTLDKTAHCAVLQTGTPLQSHYLLTVHIRSNINTRHSPEHVVSSYSASRANFASILQSLLHAGTWIIRRHFTPRVSAQFVCLCHRMLVFISYWLALRLATVHAAFAPLNAEWGRRCERQGLCGSDILWQLCHIISSPAEDSH